MIIRERLYIVLYSVLIAMTAVSCSNGGSAGITSTRNDVTNTIVMTETAVLEPSPTPYVNENVSIKIPVLYYHAVNENTFGFQQMFVRVQEFDDQMKYMKDNGYQCITFDDLPNIRNYEKPFIITFDDGYEDNFYNVYPILQKYDMKAVVYMVTEYIDKNLFLKKDQIKSMTDRVSFQSHTLTHDKLTTLSNDEIERQLRDSKDILENLTGVKVDNIAYPYGDYNDNVLQLTAKYYKYGVKMGEGIYYHNGEDLLRINRVYIPRGLSIESFKMSIGAQ